MRVSRETAAAHRAAIVRAAGRMFRRHGFERVGIAEITRAAGLTHGGFYGHFASKDALAAEACEAAFADGLAVLEGAVDLEAYVRVYLSRAHRDHPESGCPMVALGGEVAHAGAEVRARYAEGVARFVDELTKRMPGGSIEARQRRASGLAALLVGGLGLARGLGASAPEISDALLRALREEARGLIGASGDAPAERATGALGDSLPSNR